MILSGLSRIPVLHLKDAASALAFAYGIMATPIDAIIVITEYMTSDCLRKYIEIPYRTNKSVYLSNTESRKPPKGVTLFETLASAPSRRSKKPDSKRAIPEIKG